MKQIHNDWVELAMWAKLKTKVKIPWEVETPWDDKEEFKFTYGAGDGTKAQKPESVFTDVKRREWIRIVITHQKLLKDFPDVDQRQGEIDDNMDKNY